MKKRLMVGLLAGGLLAAMLPGVVSAAPNENANNPYNFGQCLSAKSPFLVDPPDPRGGFGPASKDANNVSHGPFLNGNSPFSAGTKCQLSHPIP